MVDVIVGAGQIGKGLGDILSKKYKVYYHDPAKGIYYMNPPTQNVDYLHVCIPGNISTFTQTVLGYIKEFNPMITVIHSTVVPGTTKIIAGLSKAEIVHSPIRGKHPDLALGVKTYLKHIGYLTTHSALDVAEHFEDAGIKSEIYYDPATTELGKILELFRYGVEVLLITKQTELCTSLNLNPEDTIGAFVKSYNAGLDTLGLSNLKQCLPTPMEGNHLGGHCVIENCWELYKTMSNESLKYLLAQLIIFGKGDRQLL